jgi:predicted peptidase
MFAVASGLLQVAASPNPMRTCDQAFPLAMKHFIFLTGLTFLACTCPAQEAGGNFVSQSFAGELTIKFGYKYLLTLPDGYDEAAGKKWPLLVFLHGAGERGDDLNLLKKHGPPKLIAAGRKFEAIVVSPQVTSGEYWNPHGVKALVDAVRKLHRVDDDRVYLTGISMGGFGTFDTLAHYPGVFAAAIPICGGAGINVLKFGAIRDLPLWIFHGAKDATVPIQFSEMAVNFFKRAKAPNVNFTVYPDAGHDSWTQTYDNPEVWKWLFEQTRK